MTVISSFALNLIASFWSSLFLCVVVFVIQVLNAILFCVDALRRNTFFAAICLISANEDFLALLFVVDNHTE